MVSRDRLQRVQVHEADGNRVAHGIFQALLVDCAQVGQRPQCIRALDAEAAGRSETGLVPRTMDDHTRQFPGTTLPTEDQIDCLVARTGESPQARSRAVAGERAGHREHGRSDSLLGRIRCSGQPRDAGVDLLEQAGGEGTPPRRRGDAHFAAGEEAVMRAGPIVEI
jgi:hypothetical protein